MAALLSAAMGAVVLLLLLRLTLSLKSVVYSLCKWWRLLDDRCQAYQVYKIPRYGEARQENPLFRKALAYLHSLPSLEDSECANIYSSGRKSNEYFFMQLDADQSVVADSFLGSRLSWTLTNHPSPCLLLRLRRHDRHRVLRPYLYHIETVAEDIDLRRKECRLFSVQPDGSWGCVGQLSQYPATLETVAVDAELKNRVRSDLESFLRGRSYYARLGRVWRRSYLLHGPPGTGKSAFAAAMAKFLNYDVYDLDLSRAAATDIKSLLLSAGPRSVVLVEDLDRQLSASGDKAGGVATMMTFMDGVFSCCCGDERVMVFTMSGAKEGIDPALLRPGRMDVHVCFPLCDFSAFKTLASSHLGLRDHKLYPQVEEGFRSGRARLSQAEVGEIMIANRGSPSRALKTVISALQHSSPSPGFFGSASVISGVHPEGSSDGPGGTGLGFRKEATVREFKKLYGLIRLRGTPASKKEGMMSVQVAAAAAAAANAANYPDRSF